MFYGFFNKKLILVIVIAAFSSILSQLIASIHRFYENMNQNNYNMTFLWKYIMKAAVVGQRNSMTVNTMVAVSISTRGVLLFRFFLFLRYDRQYVGLYSARKYSIKRINIQ